MMHFHLLISVKLQDFVNIHETTTSRCNNGWHHIAWAFLKVGKLYLFVIHICVIYIYICLLSENIDVYIFIYMICYAIYIRNFCISNCAICIVKKLRLT